ncbi:hypothetical protein DAEQUDRAFT_667947 [Daedalea quercina L-15889]|uniref:BTB domain-containing protein n=1 Tax=Daedalea quercina L-15889 TaxID=1314783 RepID=A0A165R628_9APHY|nr:hypothetical protein DAEQUDRAFT_667947 [Daedalea quercina L-15889]
MISPYFNFGDADVILRSAAPHSTEFRVHKSLLSAASPFFKHMFALPQTPQSCVDVPVIDVSEPKATVETLMRHVYPVSRPNIDTLDELTPVLEAAMKYDMVSVIDILRKRLVAPDFATAEPTRVYAIACRFDLEEEAKEASRYTLRVNVLDCPLHDDLKHITAYAYHRLLDLHRKRAKAAQELLQLSEDVKCMQCNGARYHAFLPPKWWADFHERAKQELAVRPTTDVVFSMPFLAQSAQAGCERCAGSILDAHWFLAQLKKSIDSLPSTI